MKRKYSLLEISELLASIGMFLASIGLFILAIIWAVKMC